MSSRTEHRPRGVWLTTQTAALCPALAVLLMALVLCLGYAPHAPRNVATAPVTTLSAVQTSSHGPAEHRAVTVTAVAERHTVTVTKSGGCPSGDMCCAQDSHGVRAVLPAAAQLLPAVLRRVPSLPGPATVACALGLTPTRGAPDLHVLQVQRT